MDRMEEAPSEYDLCGKIIGLGMKVHSALGPGFLESVYRNAVALELRRAGLMTELEKQIVVRYSGEIVGAFVADALVNGEIIVEVKVAQMLSKVHEVQLVNYLTATGMNDGLLLNFGASRFEFKRKFRQRETERASF